MSSFLTSLIYGIKRKFNPKDCINAKFVTMFRQFSFHLKEFGFASVSFHKWVRFKPDPFGLFN